MRTARPPLMEDTTMYIWVLCLALLGGLTTACGREVTNLRGRSAAGSSANSDADASGSTDQLRKNQTTTLGWDGTSFKGGATLTLIPME